MIKKNGPHFNKISHVYYKLVIVLFLFLVSKTSVLAVSFSEIAWMGTAVSANHEWIELYNPGEAVDVTGWSISDGMKLSIELAGVMPAGSYAVLERTSDESAPGSAFLIYTGALVNMGASLELRRDDNSLVDRVVGGENWVNIGGDNVTKETAQYTNSGWMTAPATPGRGISTTEVDTAKSNNIMSTVSATETAVKLTTKNNLNQSETTRLVLPDVNLKLNINAQTLGYVNQPISFEVKPSGIGETLINSLTYEWNFGDGNTATTKNSEHLFKYPGTYVVTVYAEFKRQSQVARHEITILPVALSLTTNRAGAVQLNNDSPYEIDISGYQIQGTKSFMFPPRSIILPNQTITISKDKVGNLSKQFVLFDNIKTQLALWSPDAKKANFEHDYDRNQLLTYDTVETPVAMKSVTISNITPNPLDSALQTKEEKFSFSEKRSTDDEDLINNIEAESNDTGNGNDGANDNLVLSDVEYTESNIDSKERWFFIALMGVLFLGSLGVYIKPKNNHKT